MRSSSVFHLTFTSRLRPCLLVAVGLFHLACNEDALSLPGVDLGAPAAPDASLSSGFCTADHWCWENSRPQGNDLNAVWGSAANDYWAAGERGTILHYDGHAWAPVASGSRVTFTALWGSSARDVWLAGSGGTILHFDGTTWSPVPSGTSATLRALWGSGPGDVWAVGDAVTHWDGSRWTVTGPQLDSRRQPYAIWGSGPRDLWVVGDPFAASYVNNGYHFDGQSWTPFSARPSAYLQSIWGSGPNDIWANSAYGDIGYVHWDGVSWSFTATDFVQERGMWGTGPADIWSVGHSHDGSGVEHFDGLRWSPSYHVRNTPNRSSVWGTGRDDVWVVGQAGWLDHWDGKVWSTKSSGLWVVEPSALWASSPSDIWLATWPGSMLHYDGTSWSRGAMDPRYDVKGLAGSAPDDVWAVGNQNLSSSLVAHWDGAAWRETPAGTDSMLAAAWEAARNDAWAVGAKGAIVHWDGKQWRAFSSGVSEDLIAIWGASATDIIVLGMQGAYLHFDGHAFAPAQGPPSSGGLQSIWGSGAERWVSSSDGMYHFDGAVWHREPLPSPGLPLWSGHSISGTGPHDVWAAFGQDVVHWDGVQWKVQDAGAYTHLILALEHDVWAAGDPNAIVRLRR